MSGASNFAIDWEEGRSASAASLRPATVAWNVGASRP